MKFKELHEQYHNLRKNRYLFCTELEELIKSEIHDFDARAYINLDKVIIKTNLKMTLELISKITKDYYLELDYVKTVTNDNLISTVTNYEYTFKSDKIQEEIDEFEKYRLELLDKTKVLPKKLVQMEVDNTDEKIKEYSVNDEVLNDLAMLEHTQWCELIQSIKPSIVKLIGLIDLEMLSGEDMVFVEEQLDMLDEWSYLLVPFDELPEDRKEFSRLYAYRVVDRLYFMHNIKL